MKSAVSALILLSVQIVYSQHNDQLIDLFGPKMKPGVACYRIPALITTKDGTVIAVADERMGSCQDLGKNDDINLVIRRSRNDGRTWSSIETLIDFPKGQSASDASLLTDTQTGEVFLLYNFMDHVNHKGRYRFHLMRSSDAGKTWTKPEDITRQIIQPDWLDDFMFITSGNGIQTRSGVLLHTLVSVTRNSGWVFGSVDHGKTWQLFPGELKPADESKITELSDGRWMVNARVNKTGYRFVHTSDNQGKSWTTSGDTRLTDPGCNAALLTTSSGSKKKLLFVNLNDARQRQNLSVRFSSDDGLTWSNPRTIYSGSAAYACLSEMSGGKAGLIFERDDYGKISFVRIKTD